MDDPVERKKASRRRGAALGALGIGLLGAAAVLKAIVGQPNHEPARLSYDLDSGNNSVEQQLIDIATETRAQLPMKLDDLTEVTNVFASERGLYYYASFNTKILPERLATAKADMLETVRAQSCATPGVAALINDKGVSIHWHYNDPAGQFFDITVDHC
jgi:hypothetical protein